MPVPAASARLPTAAYLRYDLQRRYRQPDHQWWQWFDFQYHHWRHGGSISSADIGEIYSTSADLYFSSGNLLLNSKVHTGTLINSGATLQVNNLININGKYSQSASATC
jgi:hypothetical protein